MSNSIQVKIYQNFERDLELRVLFLFNDSVDWVTVGELDEAEWPVGYRYVHFKGDWFTTKVNLDGEIVSDALRYELAVSLVEELAKSRHTAKLGAALAVLPTETKFCKPALLPHRSMTNYGNGSEMKMSVDNKLLESTEKRTAQLQAYKEGEILLFHPSSKSRSTKPTVCLTAANTLSIRSAISTTASSAPTMAGRSAWAQAWTSMRSRTATPWPPCAKNVAKPANSTSSKQRSNNG